MSETKIYQLEEWRNEAAKRFGPDPKNWKYKCCNCGHEQTINDFVKAGIKEPENKVFFSCIGRWTEGKGTLGDKKTPCNYTLGGLIRLSNVFVIDGEGGKHHVFDFAPAEKQEATPKTPVAPIATLLLLILMLASCAPSRYLECPRDVSKVTGDTVPEWMHISMRPKGFVISQKALSVRVNGICSQHLQCDGKPFPVHYKVGWCEGKEELFNQLVKERRVK